MAKESVQFHVSVDIDSPDRNATGPVSPADLDSMRWSLLDIVYDWLKSKGGELYGMERPESYHCIGLMDFDPKNPFFIRLLGSAWCEAAAWSVCDLRSLSDAVSEKLPDLPEHVQVRLWFQDVPGSSTMGSFVQFCCDPPVDDSVEFLRPDGYTTGITVKINVPNWFQHPDFIEWLTSRTGDGLATWHKTGGHLPGDYSDVFVGVDPGLSGEGTDSDMPEPFWSYVVTAAKKAAGSGQKDHIIVWISPV